MDVGSLVNRFLRCSNRLCSSDSELIKKKTKYKIKLKLKILTR